MIAFDSLVVFSPNDRLMASNRLFTFANGFFSESQLHFKPAKIKHELIFDFFFKNKNNHPHNLNINQLNEFEMSVKLRNYRDEIIFSLRFGN